MHFLSKNDKLDYAYYALFFSFEFFLTFKTVFSEDKILNVHA